MGIFFGQETRKATFVEPPIPAYLGASVPVRTPVGSSDPLIVPTVWACVGLLANAVSMLPLETFKRDPDGVPTRTKSTLR